MFNVKLERGTKQGVTSVSNLEYLDYLSVAHLLNNFKNKSNSPALGAAKEHLIEFTKNVRAKSRKAGATTEVNITINSKRKYPRYEDGKVSFVDYKVNKKYPTYKEAREGFAALKASLRSKIQSARAEYRSFEREDRITTNTTTHDGESFIWTLVGGVHIEPNKFLQIKQFTSVKKVFRDKTPKTNDNHLGIELEFFCAWDRNKLAKALFDAGLADKVCLKTDGSIKEYDTGKYIAHELCVLVKETEYKSVVKAITDILALADARINKSCGMHVHLDMRYRNKEIVFSNLVSAQPQLYAMNPVSRETGTFSRKTDTKVFQTAASQSGRYHGVNSKAYERHKTIEVRIHAGTVDFNKIVSWVEILVAIANKQDETKASARTIEGFIEKFNINPSLKGYIEERINKFNKQRDGQPIEEEVA